MADFSRIKKECFWDESIAEEDIKRILLNGTSNEKLYLFQKILLNSTMLFEDLKLFNPDELKFLIEGYKLPQFNKEFAIRRKNLAEVYFLRKQLIIDELKWIA